MKFHDSDPSINWLAHAKAPTTGKGLVEAQFSAAHRYYNTLIEIERSRQQKYLELRRELVPALEAAEAEYAKLDGELSAVRDEIKQANAKTHKRSTGTPEQRAEIKRLKGERTACAKVAKEVRERAKDSAALANGAEAINDEARAAVRAARAATETFWCSYLQVEAAVQQASKDSKPLPPRFKRWTGDGTVSVQLQGGLSWSGLLAGDDTRARLVARDWSSIEANTRAPNGKHDKPSPSGRRAKRRFDLWLRVGSDGRKPVWAVFPIVLYREPIGADELLVKWIHVDRIKRATAYVWQARFVLAKKSGWAKTCSPSGTVGVDVGWRLVPDGLRVAYWVGSDGREGQLVLPQELLNAKDDMEAIQTIRDKNFSAMKLRLARWFKRAQGELVMEGELRLPTVAAKLPAWMTDSPGLDRDGKPKASIVAGMPHWKSPGRAESLYRQWRDNRFTGDDDGFRMLSDWRNGSGKPHEHGDLHLWRFQTGRRIRALKRRKDIYRKFARELAQNYAVCRVEKLNLAEMRRRPEAEDDKASGAVVMFRNLAANGELLECLRQSGMAVEALPAENTTRMHLACGHISSWSDEERAAVMVTCQGCGESYDQDDNSAKLLLAGGVASVEVVGTV
jgi:hypothetical protein